MIATAGAGSSRKTADNATCRGGTTLTASPPHLGVWWSTSATGMAAEERTLRGSYLGSTVPTRDVPRDLRLWHMGRPPVDRILGEEFALACINMELDRLQPGEALRQVVMKDA